MSHAPQRADGEPSERWIDWSNLERTLPLDDLPRLHRALLTLHDDSEPWDDAPLRRVQGKVGATLKRLERAGRVRRDGERLLIDVAALPSAFLPHDDAR
jgi:hypothetical protein